MTRLGVVCLATMALIAGCGGGDAMPERAAGAIVRDDANARVAITVGSKNFTEQEVLGEIYGQGLAAAGFRVDTELNLGDEQTALRALERGVIDGYPEYTGTVLVSLCDVPTRRVPREEAAAYERARECLRPDGLVAFAPTPFSSTNEVGVKQAVADELDLRAISDLRRVDQRFTLYGSPECPRRRDCLLGLRRRYGLRFRRFVPVAIAQRHEVLDRPGRAASIVFTTDPQITRQDIALLADDENMFPPANSTFVVDEDVARRAGPALPRAIAQVQQGLTAEVMRELNARVDLDGRTPAAVAAAYLRAAGLVG